MEQVENPCSGLKSLQDDVWTYPAGNGPHTQLGEEEGKTLLKTFSQKKSFNSSLECKIWRKNWVKTINFFWQNSN